MTGLRDVAIIGGGQAGLAMSACLTAAGIDHVVLERGTIGERWRSERWPGLRLLTPNWMTRLPGPVPAVADPDGFMTAGDFARHLAVYGRASGAPVLTRVAVLSVDAEGGRYRIATTAGTFRAKAVVVATGACDVPAVPGWGGGLAPHLHQVTPDRYGGPAELPQGGVLVVGASASGAQIARDLRRAGREVVLSAGRHVRAPRAYRGRDLFHWLDASGFLADRLPPGPDMVRLRSQPSLQLAGSRTDGEVGLNRLAAEGVEVVGRTLVGAGTQLCLAPDLPDQFRASEARRRKLLSRIDAHVVVAGLDVPEDPEAWQAPAPPGPGPGLLDLDRRGIRTVVWATGYRRRYTWLRLPVLDAAGEVRNTGGITPLPGLFVLGLPFQRHRASAFIDGVGRDAEALLPAVARHLGAPVPIAA